MKTKDRLTEALREIGLEELAVQAQNGDFDEFESHFSEPIAKLTFELGKINSEETCQFAERVLDGEFAATNEEVRAWFTTEGGEDGVS